MIVASYLSVLPCGKRGRGGLKNGPKFGSQRELATCGDSKSLLKWSPIGVQLQAIVHVKWFLKGGQVWPWSDIQQELAMCAS